MAYPAYVIRFRRCQASQPLPEFPLRPALGSLQSCGDVVLRKMVLELAPSAVDIPSSRVGEERLDDGGASDEATAHCGGISITANDNAMASGYLSLETCSRLGQDSQPSGSPEFDIDALARNQTPDAITQAHALALPLSPSFNSD